MLLRKTIFLICSLILIELSSAFNNGIDKSCLPRRYGNRSNVCVCNKNYCDEITRKPVPKGSYVVYTSSEDGLRFSKSSSNFQQWYYTGPVRKPCTTILDLDPKKLYQTIQGFGGAVTDAAGINYDKLTDPKLKQLFVDSYFGRKGLEYNMMRVPIGGCDFSTHAYAYNEYPENDAALTNYSLAYEDYRYKLPLIKAAFKASTDRIDIVATTWSPPGWMKNNHNITGTSRLKKKYYQTFADYHKKFIELYAAEGIPIWAVTTTNEPLDGVMNLARFNTLGWSIKGMGEWIKNNLGPTIRKSGYDVKILAVDDQRFLIPMWFNMLVQQEPGALKYIDGVAVHFYADIVTPASMLTETMVDYSDKFVISTEACTGAYEWEVPKVDLGSWERATRYVGDILENLNNNVTGWIDWNVALDIVGGPNWVQNYVDSPVIVFPDKGEFVKQPMFYAMGHFSKFIPRGSRRIGVTTDCPTPVQYTAFKTPNDTISVVLFNNETSSNVITLKLNFKQAQVSLPAKSFTTVEFNNEWQ